jgi:hypothetical protein
MNKKKHKDLEYPIRSFRIKNETWNILKQKKIESGLSWNLFIYNLIKQKQ